MYNEIPYCALGLEVTGKFLREVFLPWSVCKTLYLHIMLSVQPGLVILVLCECLTLVAHWFNVAPTAVVISETNEIFPSVMALGCCWPPHVRMDFYHNISCTLVRVCPIQHPPSARPESTTQA